MVREVVLPVLVPFLLFVGMVVLGLRRPVPRRGRGPRRGPVGVALIRHVALTVGGGYVAFALIVLAFEVGVVPDALGPALVRGGGLSLFAGSAFVALSWAEALLRRRRC